MSAAILASHQLTNMTGIQAPPPPGLCGSMPPGLGHIGSPNHIRPANSVTIDDVSRLQQELNDKRQMMIKWEEGMKQAATVSCRMFLHHLISFSIIYLNFQASAVRSSPATSQNFIMQFQPHNRQLPHQIWSHHGLQFHQLHALKQTSTYFNLSSRSWHK